MRTVRIFLSSPDDVAVERARARDILGRLARSPFFRGRLLLDVVSREDPRGGATMDAPLTPQQAIDRSRPTPAECDLTVLLLWGRMGTPLTETRADGSQYLSGTEWEFENALRANKPVLVYRRTEKVLLDPSDDEFDEKLTQKKRVDAFFEQLKDDGDTLLRTYASVDDLMGRLKQDVERHLISHLLREPEVVQSRSGSKVPAQSPSSTTVFICYRREDSQDAAGRLYDRLVHSYGQDRVFIDIDSVPLGVDFVERVSEQIARCTAVIVVIGKQWLKAKDKGRRRRLDNENDFVRAEIETALQQKVPLIPVLVQDADMPTAEQLPEKMRRLARMNGMELSATRWRTDVERLIKELDGLMNS